MQIVSSETICMKYQSLFSMKNKKYFNMSAAFLSSMLNVKIIVGIFRSHILID